MVELNEELIEEIKEKFKLYRLLMSQKESMTSHNRSLKSDFTDIHFKDEDPEDRKQLKKEINRYLTSIMEVSEGKEPVSEIKNLRKTHLGFEDDSLYDELIIIYKQITENNRSKEEISDRIEKEISIPLSLNLRVNNKVVLGIFKLWRNIELGKLPLDLDIVEGYIEIISKVNK